MSIVRLSLVLGLCLVMACGDDEKGTSASDAGTDAAVEPGTPCTRDEDCDDQLFCDGEETCKDGACVPGEEVTCVDDIACTIDQCSERKRACESLAPDLDGDGHFLATCKNKKGEALGDDCDDNDPLRFPGNIESCEPGHKDDDCDPTTFGEKDSDDDGFFDATCCNAESDKQGAKLTCGTDCDDLKPSVNPKATEACDLFDNDCDGTTDENVSVKMYPDADRDGHGQMSTKGSKVTATMKCPGAVGFAGEQNDCNDKSAEVFVGQFEICDDKDNDCDGKSDEVEEDAPWFVDVDEDGFGDATGTPIYSCERIPGRVLSHNDCNDEKGGIHPAAPELCDAVDNDCSGARDFQLGINDFEDDDNDSIADDMCTGGDDCNDTDPSTGDGLDEVCDKRDNDCDKAIDEETAQTVWYLDKDGDGWGIDQGTALARCEPIPGRSANLGDCDDSANSVHPTAPETCNGADDNCNDTQDEATDYQCSMDNALGFCKLGGCAVLSCYPGFDDVDANAANGCEKVVPIVSNGNTCVNGTDAECDNDDYCDGKERCIAMLCYDGTPTNCDASDNVLQGSFFIHNSLDIQTLTGIETITGDLVISAAGLVNLTGLEDLKTVGGDLIIDGVLDTDPDATNNKSLVALVGSGLSNLTTVAGDILIEQNLKLTTIRLPSLVTAKSITIRSNDALTTLDGFDSLVKVTDEIRIELNSKLTTLTAMQALTNVGRLTIFDNPITEITFAGLTKIRGHLDLSGVFTESGINSTTKKVSMPLLTQIDGGFYVKNFEALTTVSFPKLKAVLGHDFYLYGNTLMDDPDFHSFDTFTLVTTPTSPSDTPSLDLTSNPALTTLDRFGQSIDCPCLQCYAYFNNDTSLDNCDIVDATAAYTGFTWIAIANNKPGSLCSDND